MSLPQSVEDLSGRLCAVGLGLFDQNRWVWKDVDLMVAPGERVVLSGPSGCGKTAMLLVLAGLLAADEGQVLLEGRTMADWFMPEYRSHVAYLPQRPMLNDAEQVEALIALPFSYRVHAGRHYDRDLVLQWLDCVGRKPDFLQRRIGSLSGGEQQLAALLRTLALQPRLLLLDEPTAALDAVAVGQVESLLAEWLRADRERCWLWVSHDQAQIQRVADRVVTL